MKKRRRNYLSNNFSKGFTLLEVLVVITIISLIGIITLTTMGIGRTKNNLRTAQREVSSMIKLAQSYALQGKITSNGEAPCGFGFNFSDENSYRIFFISADSGVSCEEKNKNSSYRHYLNETDSPNLEEIELKNNIILKEGTDLGTTEIYFTVPHANIYGSSGNTFGGTSITLTDLKGETSRDIVIDQKGLISEEE